MTRDIAVDAVVPRKGKSNTLLFTMGVFVVAILIAGRWFLRTTGAASTLPGDNGDIRSVLHLESFVVNPSGTSENGHLRVGIDLAVASEVKGTESNRPSWDSSVTRFFLFQERDPWTNWRRRRPNLRLYETLSVSVQSPGVVQ